MNVELAVIRAVTSAWRGAVNNINGTHDGGSTHVGRCVIRRSWDSYARCFLLAVLRGPTQPLHSSFAPGMPITFYSTWLMAQLIFIDFERPKISKKICRIQQNFETSLEAVYQQIFALSSFSTQFVLLKISISWNFTTILNYCNIVLCNDAAENIKSIMASFINCALSLTHTLQLCLCKVYEVRHKCNLNCFTTHLVRFAEKDTKHAWHSNGYF